MGQVKINRISALEELRSLLANLKIEGEMGDEGQAFSTDSADTQETLEMIIEEARRIGGAS